MFYTFKVSSVNAPQLKWVLHNKQWKYKHTKRSYMFDMVQVALNWLVAQDNVIPIPGAKNAEQAKEFGGALGWRLTNDEVNELRDLASKSKPVMGFPVEKL